MSGTASLHIPLKSRESRRRDSPEERERSSSRRRPSIEVKIVNGHRRHGSNKSSSQDGEDEEQRRRRRRNSHVRFEDDEKQKKLQSAIDRANEDIANRPAVPPSPNTSRAPARYRRGSVVVDPSETSLITAMDQLKLERKQQEREQRRREKLAAAQRERELEEEEAQRQRLKERMAPRRPTDSLTHGRARQKVVYDDGERGRNVDDSCNALNGLVICVLLVPWSGLQVYGI